MLQFTTINLNHYFTTFYFFFADDRLLRGFWNSSSDDGCVAIRSFSVEDCVATWVRLLTFAMILLVGSTEVHRMWSPETRAQTFEFHPPVHLVKVHRIPPVAVIGVVAVVAVVVQHDVV